MARYKSVDALQNAMATSVFEHTSAPKKAAGRALGTLVELITFYMIRDWGLEMNLAIERGLPEYGNTDITHNVEFTLHETLSRDSASTPPDGRTITPTVISKALGKKASDFQKLATGRWLLRQGVTRHACTFAEDSDGFWNAYLIEKSDYDVAKLSRKPYAMLECKRVGVEEGQKKGPQTIEKAKQGAYVARSVSGLQRIPRKDGSVSAVVEESDGSLTTHSNYYQFLRSAIDSRDFRALDNVVLTVGVVSNHGNWFTNETQNKEMRVLAQSYDWLLFLTDDALAEFIDMVLQGDDERFENTRRAFKESYAVGKKATKFTKVTIDSAADLELTSFFKEFQPWGKWFNVITPKQPIARLKEDLVSLSQIQQESR